MGQLDSGGRFTFTDNTYMQLFSTFPGSWISSTRDGEVHVIGATLQFVL